MLLSIEGEEKTGKTTLAYTAPLPIIGFSFDLGSRRAIQGVKYKELFADRKIQIIGPKEKAGNLGDYDITIFELPQPIQLNSDQVVGCQALWDKLVQLFAEAVQGDYFRSVVFDTMTLARRLKAEAYLETLQKSGNPRKQLMQIEYGNVNDAIRNVYNISQSLNMNLVALHHTMEEYKNIINSKGEKESVPTGNLILEGYNKTYQAVDVALRTGRDNNGMFAVVRVCGFDPSMEGMKLTNGLLSWDGLVKTIEMRLDSGLTFDKRNPE